MLVELSYPLDEASPKWPTNPGEELEYVLAIDKGDNCYATTMHHHMHNGTHVDAPKHFFLGGDSIDQMPIELFYYTRPVILDLPKITGGHIGLDELRKHEDVIAKADLLALHMGYAGLRDHDPQKFIDAFPALTPEAARYLRGSFPDLKALALDVVGADDPVNAVADGFPVHKALLAGREQRPLLLYEDVNLAAMWKVREKIMAVCAFPVRFRDAEAAPVNIVAICRD